MKLQEQLEKVQKDLEKVEERRKELQKKEKELRTKIELETAKEEAKKNEEIPKDCRRSLWTSGRGEIWKHFVSLCRNRLGRGSNKRKNSKDMIWEEFK